MFSDKHDGGLFRRKRLIVNALEKYETVSRFLDVRQFAALRRAGETPADRVAERCSALLRGSGSSGSD
jgi:hypothetical protein